MSFGEYIYIYIYIYIYMSIYTAIYIIHLSPVETKYNTVE